MGTLLLENVTISGNVSGGWGGGKASIGFDASSNLTNTTLSGNFANMSGGGMVNIIGSETTIVNTIVWGNSAGIEGPQLYNKVPETGQQAGVVNIDDSIVPDGCPESTTCTDVLKADPLLGTLGDYGGLTQTIPISVGSSALNAASEAFCPALDQRGIAHPQGRGCDIGAFERVHFEIFLPMVVQ